MDVFFKKRTIRIHGVLYDLSEPRVMGILNYTPDSFYDGGRYPDSTSVIDRVEKMVEDGVDFIDVGAVSTRPGASQVSEKEEISRLSSVLGIIRSIFPDVIISVDTFRSEAAKKAVKEFGAGMINDISSGNMDNKMLETIAELQVPYVAMHMQGTPQTMQENPEYGDVVNDVIRFFAERVSMMRQYGINDVIIDPGFGFGKTLEHNYILAGRLEELGMLDLPVIVGFSRKSMIYNELGLSPAEALAGTVALNAVAIIKGANILRVHDVREARDTIRVVSRLRKLPAGKS
jgi:dihydropteroate synthase